MHTQMDFTVAENARDLGMMIAEDNANRKVTGWSNMAMSYLRGYLSMHGTTPFLAEEVREYAKAHGLEDAPSNRAWGGVMTRASRAGLIKSVGFRLTTNPLAHRTPATLWAKA